MGGVAVRARGDRGTRLGLGWHLTSLPNITAFKPLPNSFPTIGPLPKWLSRQVIQLVGDTKRSQLSLPNRFLQGELVSAEYFDVIEQQR